MIINPFRAARNYAPQTIEEVEFNHVNYQLRPEVPAQHAELMNFVESAGASPVPVRVDAPDHVAIELCAANEQVVVHLVNYNNEQPLVDVEVTLQPALVTADAATCFVVDTDQRHDLGLEPVEDGTLRLRVPLLQTYTVVVVNRQ